MHRVMAVLSDKVIPKSQFLCRPDVNIVDELRDLRNINLHLKGVNGAELDGSLLSIDFKNAFRSLSWRWILLVMKKSGVPVQFVEWLKAMYDGLGISIVISFDDFFLAIFIARDSQKSSSFSGMEFFKTVIETV